MAHQYIPKIFHGPHKTPPAPPPTYLMYGPLYTLNYNTNTNNTFKSIALEKNFEFDMVLK